MHELETEPENMCMIQRVAKDRCREKQTQKTQAPEMLPVLGFLIGVWSSIRRTEARLPGLPEKAIWVSIQFLSRGQSESCGKPSSRA